MSRGIPIIFCFCFVFAGGSFQGTVSRTTCQTSQKIKVVVPPEQALSFSLVIYLHYL